LDLTKSQIAERSTEAWWVSRIAELEEANARLHTELDAARSRLVEIEHCEQALASENGGLKKDLENACTAHNAIVKDNADVQKTERVKLHQF
jgi:regulator of replication initiation timing